MSPSIKSIVSLFKNKQKKELVAIRMKFEEEEAIRLKTEEFFTEYFTEHPYSKSDNIERKKQQKKERRLRKKLETVQSL